MGDFSTLFANLDPDPRVRGKQFEHICRRRGADGGRQARRLGASLRGSRCRYQYAGGGDGCCEHYHFGIGDVDYHQSC
jgi:hypothetical protein